MYDEACAEFISDIVSESAEEACIAIMVRGPAHARFLLTVDAIRSSCPNLSEDECADLIFLVGLSMHSDVLATAALYASKIKG